MQNRKILHAKKTLDGFVPRINNVLQKFWEQEKRDTKTTSNNIDKIAALLLTHSEEHNLRKAKRLRAAFVYYCYKLLKPDSPDKNILEASAFIELVHTALLMHDDFMDKDDIRRGGLTTHVFFKEYHKKNLKFGKHFHFGNSLAVDVGDGALTLGYRYLLRIDFENEKKIEALEVLFSGIIETVYGQAYDLILESSSQYSQQDIIDLHCAKTSVYTYKTPSLVGAILAGAREDDLQLITEYAIPGGVAFQLQDDVLGLYGNTEKTGKPAHADLRQGKKTLLIIKALELGDRKQVRRIMEVLGNNNIVDEDADDVREIVKETGALKYSNAVALQYARKSQGTIPKMLEKGWDKHSIDFLDGIAEYMAVGREV